MITYLAVVFLLHSVAAHKCCAPPQWEGIEGLLTGSVEEGHAAVTVGNIKLSVDSTAQKIALMEDLEVGTERKRLQIIQDYPNHVQYIIENSTCTKTTAPAWHPQCIPDNATLVNTYYFGPPDHQLPITTYLFMVGTIYNKVGVTTNCTPVVNEQYGTINGVSLLTDMAYRGVTFGIKDPKVFDIPASCRHAQHTQSDRRRRRVPFQMD